MADTLFLSLEHTNTNTTRSNSKLNQLLKLHKQAAKQISMILPVLAVLLAIFISVTFLIQLSPSIHLFNNTKFWFIISNAIVIIIAVDSGAFSSSKQVNQDLYEEFLMNSKTKNTAAATTTTTSIIAKSPSPSDFDMKPVTSFHRIDLEAHNHKEGMQEQSIEVGNSGYVRARRGKRTKPRYNRSNTKVRSDVGNEDKRILRRSETEKSEEKLGKEDEFSAMSDEELNRRVEEFIEKFNRQIRLQESSLEVQAV